MEVAIIDYGAGNVKSVAFALERLGVQPKLTKILSILPPQIV